MIGMVLAAGAGKRLGSLTEDLPKTLLEVDGDRTILDIALGNFAAVGFEEAVSVTGFAAERIDERLEALSDRYGLSLRTVFNPKALEWNNAYSLWCARDEFARGVLLANGDTVHPSSVQETLLSGRNGDDLVIALDQAKTLGEEEMKVHLSAEGQLDRIHKTLEPSTGARKYARTSANQAGGSFVQLVGLHAVLQRAVSHETLLWDVLVVAREAHREA